MTILLNDSYQVSDLALNYPCECKNGIIGSLCDCMNGKLLPVPLNTLRLRQNGLHFPDDIFKCIFLDKNIYVSIKISLKFFPKGPINNFPPLVQIMAWHHPVDKPLSEPMMAWFIDTQMRHLAPMS